MDVHMIQKHGKEHKGQELLCNQCDYKVIGQPSKLEVHIETKHKTERATHKRDSSNLEGVLFYIYIYIYICISIIIKTDRLHKRERPPI